ncbi:MAG: CDP-alcohol phosphatidyltransferase family protein, partial [Crenarchaeota archaeon]|nr:CDP-alcohol phosphatidyltransferase family protein [Thermoproteota archaeon]
MTRLRPRLRVVVESVARPLSRLPADFYTVLGLVMVVPYLYACMLGRPLAAAVLLLAGAAMDAVDGAVARLRGEAGPRGAYLDSLLDRVADLGYAAGLLLLGYGVWSVYLFAGGALLTSYARARFES